MYTHGYNHLDLPVVDDHSQDCEIEIEDSRSRASEDYSSNIKDANVDLLHHEEEEGEDGLDPLSDSQVSQSVTMTDTVVKHHTLNNIENMCSVTPHFNNNNSYGAINTVCTDSEDSGYILGKAGNEEELVVAVNSAELLDQCNDTRCRNGTGSSVYVRNEHAEQLANYFGSVRKVQQQQQTHLKPTTVLNDWQYYDAEMRYNEVAVVNNTTTMNIDLTLDDQLVNLNQPVKVDLTNQDAEEDVDVVDDVDDDVNDESSTDEVINLDTTEDNDDSDASSWFSSDSNTIVDYSQDEDTEGDAVASDYIPCPKCSLRFANISKLKRHMLGHFVEKAYQCKVCMKAFDNRQVLKYHINSHKENRNYGCNKCEATFLNLKDAEEHKLAVHVKLIIHTCNICDADFHEESTYRKHLLTHNKPDKSNHIMTESKGNKQFVNNNSQLLPNQFNNEVIQLIDNSKVSKITDKKLGSSKDADEIKNRIETHRIVNRSTNKIFISKKQSNESRLEDEQNHVKCKVCQKKFKTDIRLHFHQLFAHPLLTSGDESSQDDCQPPLDIHMSKQTIVSKNKLMPRPPNQDNMEKLEETPKIKCKYGNEEFSSRAAVNGHQQAHNCDERTNPASDTQEIIKPVPILRSGKSKKRRYIKCSYCAGIYTMKQNMLRHVRNAHGKRYYKKLLASSLPFEYVTKKKKPKGNGTNQPLNHKQTTEEMNSNNHLKRDRQQNHDTNKPDKARDDSDSRYGSRNSKVTELTANLKRKRNTVCPESASSENSKTINHHKISSIKVDTDQNEQLDNMQEPKRKRKRRRLLCEECDNFFYNPNKLKQHLMVHKKMAEKNEHRNNKANSQSNTGTTKPTWINCSKCSEKFKSVLRLTQHMMCTHTDAKVYKCRVSGCTSVFFKETGLKRHEIVHSDERPFPCDKCSIAFKRRQDLKCHMVVHNGRITKDSDGMEYRCRPCNKVFTRQAGLHLHKKHYHKEALVEVVVRRLKVK